MSWMISPPQTVPSYQNVPDGTQIATDRVALRHEVAEGAQEGFAVAKPPDVYDPASFTL